MYKLCDGHLPHHVFLLCIPPTPPCHFAAFFGFPLCAACLIGCHYVLHCIIAGPIALLRSSSHASPQPHSPRTTQTILKSDWQSALSCSSAWALASQCRPACQRLQCGHVVAVTLHHSSSFTTVHQDPPSVPCRYCEAFEVRSRAVAPRIALTG